MTKLNVLKNYRDYVIDNKDKHNWCNPSTCHCGMLLSSCGIEPMVSKEQVRSFFSDLDLGLNINDGWYTHIFNFYKNPNCDVTNLPFTEVIDQLIAMGFTLEELIKLEFLKDTRFNKECNNNKVNTLLTYLDNWIKYEKLLCKSTTTTPVTISV
jgi:hypothetical protein